MRPKTTRAVLFSFALTGVLAGRATPVLANGVLPPRLALPRISRPPTLPDFLGVDIPEAPAGMRRIEGFVVRSPNDGAPVSESTIAYLGYDDDNLYVVFVCLDREPGKIGAHLAGRDSFPSDEDSVAVHLDTFRDLRHAYGFQVSALGVQTDGIYTEGAGWDLSWDGVWQTDGRLTGRGYVVLVSIPFKTLRFPAADAQEWGLFLYRGIARRNEDAYWPACSTRVAARLPQAALVDGIDRVSRGWSVQAIPYAGGRSSKALDLSSSAPAFVSKRGDGSLGVDAKVVVRDSVVVDATVNPDFSQFESDQPQITVNKPFEVLFPEKRPFFLENATFFTTPIQLLFTRRIADPLLGARATARIGAFSGAAMVVDDRAPFDAPTAGPKAWSWVGRATWDLGSESYIGGFFSRRERADSSNAVTAADARVRLGPNWFVVAQSAVSRTGDATRATTTGWASLASVICSGRRLSYALQLNDRSAGFRAVDGFITRVDVRSVDQTASFRTWPERGALQSWGPDLILNRTWDHEGHPLDWIVTTRMVFQWPRSTTLEVYHTAGRETLRPAEVPSVDRPLLMSTDRTGVNFTTALLPRLVGSATLFVGDAGNLTPVANALPSVGHLLDLTTSLSIRFSRSVTLDCSYLLDRLQDAESGHTVYSDGIVRARLGMQLTRSLSARAIVQYNRLSVDPERTALQPTRRLNYDVLLTYLRSPGTAVYFGANYDLANLDPLLGATPAGLLRSPTLNNDGWQVFVKVSYLVRP